MNCPFCDKEIIATQKIYETQTEYVIYNIRPANKGHCLVVPKRHVQNITQLTDEEAASLIKTVKYIYKKLKEHLNPVGFNNGFNDGEYAGQTVEHFHFHIIPRFKNDNLPEFHLFHRDPKTKRNFSDEEIKPFVEEFRKILNPL
ncbi:HIT family protein [Candidatus Falkowbacteria bacterium]|nr:HIT family protein [Candidatus Falkowbacteria bacterium]